MGSNRKAPVTSGSLTPGEPRHARRAAGAMRVQAIKQQQSTTLALLQRRSRKVAHRESQRRYESRQRAGVGLFPVPLTSSEIEVLISLGWLREGEESNRQHVGEAVANALRELGRALTNHNS